MTRALQLAAMLVVAPGVAVLSGCATTLNPLPAVPDGDGVVTLTPLNRIGVGGGIADDFSGAETPASLEHVSAVAASGADVFVVDAVTSTLFSVTAAGGRAKRIRQLRGQPGSGLYAAADGSVLIADTQQSAVLRLDADGRELRRYAAAGYLVDPVDVVADDQTDEVMVVDRLTGNLIVFGAAGSVLRIIEADTVVAPPRALARRGQDLIILYDTPPWLRHMDAATEQTTALNVGSLAGARAVAFDRCGRVFAGGTTPATIYVWTDRAAEPAVVRIPGAQQINDLWASQGRLFVATSGEGVMVLLVEPRCG